MQDLYTEIVAGKYTDVVERTGRDQYTLCCKTLAYALLAKSEEADDLLRQTDFSTLASLEQSIYLEAKAILAYHRKAPGEGNRLADIAVGLDPSAVFAHTLLGRYGERHRQQLEAYLHFKAIADRYPQYEPALYACCRTLLFIRNPRQAGEYLKKVSASPKKALYSLAAQIYFRNTFITIVFILGLLVLMLFPWCYYVLTGLFFIGMAWVLRKYNADLLLSSSLLITELVATFFFFTVLILESVF